MPFEGSMNRFFDLHPELKSACAEVASNATGMKKPEKAALQLKVAVWDQLDKLTQVLYDEQQPGSKVDIAGLYMQPSMQQSVLCSAVAQNWGATTVVIKASPLAYISPSKTLLYQLSVSSLVLPVVSLVFGESGITAITPMVGLSLLYQIVWIAFITYIAWFWLISNYAVSKLASFTFLTPIFGVIAGALILNETITPYLFSALVLVGTGIYLVNRRI